MRSDIRSAVYALVSEGFLCPPRRAMRSDDPVYARGRAETAGFYALRGGLCVVTEIMIKLRCILGHQFLCPPRRAMRSDSVPPIWSSPSALSSFYALRGGLCVVTPRCWPRPRGSRFLCPPRRAMRSDKSRSFGEPSEWERFYALRGGLCVVTVVETRGV